MKKIYICITLAFSSYIFGQVGINIEEAKVTLQIEKTTPYIDGTPAGLSIPQLTGDQIEAMVTTNVPKSTLVYATVQSTATIGKIVNNIGYWYYDGTIWLPLASSAKQLWEEIAGGTIQNVNSSPGKFQIDKDGRVGINGKPQDDIISIYGDDRSGAGYDDINFHWIGAVGGVGSGSPAAVYHNYAAGWDNTAKEIKTLNPGAQIVAFEGYSYVGKDTSNPEDWKERGAYGGVANSTILLRKSPYTGDLYDNEAGEIFLLTSPGNGVDKTQNGVVVDRYGRLGVGYNIYYKDVLGEELRGVLDVKGNAYIDGSLYANNIVTKTSTYPDYVFQNYYDGFSTIKDNGYKMMSLKETESFVKENKHLPGVKSYKEIEKAGGSVDLGELSVSTLEKVEELYLHMIEKDKKIEELEQKIENLTNQLNSQK